MSKTIDQIPEHLQAEYQKYLDNPDKYKKLYPVAYGALMAYIEDHNED